MVNNSNVLFVFSSLHQSALVRSAIPPRHPHGLCIRSMTNLFSVISERSLNASTTLLSCYFVPVPRINTFIIKKRGGGRLLRRRCYHGVDVPSQSTATPPGTRYLGSYYKFCEDKDGSLTKISQAKSVTVIIKANEIGKTNKNKCR